MNTLTLDQAWQIAQTQSRERVERETSERLSQIPPQALEWLALLPIWTVGLADACGFPSADGEPPRETLLRIHGLGLCRHTPAAAPDPASERFWMSSDQRATQIARAIQDYESGRDEIQRTVKDLTDRVRQSGTVILPIVERWAALASAEHPAEIGKRLLDQVEREPSQIARWLEAARPLEEIFKGEVTAAFVRALRRMEHQDRRDADFRMLKKYVVRSKQLDDFEELLNGLDDLWALHYVGAGGVGKTMLMRHLSGERIPALGGTSARIDFDHINPDYPSRAPGLLLVQLAEELRLQSPSGAAEELFGSFFEKMSTLQEQFGRREETPVPEAALSSPLFELALNNLAEAVQRLPRPVVILLDTCEELAKVQLDGQVPHNVATTFRILEEMHRRAPFLRVVFCGRRLLASAGSGWWLETPHPVHPARLFLRLHVMRGFDPQEAESFLGKGEVPEKLREPILLRSRAAGFFIPEGRGRAAPWTGTQYSPYSLDLHAAWVQENPDVTIGEILDSRVDPFVRIRVLSRLPASLEGLLPTVALLGSFDEPTLLAASGFDPDGFDALFRELADQEWVARLGSNLLEVEPEMRTRLVDYVRPTQESELDRVRRRALDHLKQKIVDNSGDVPVSELAPAEFEVALRLLEPFPEEAAEWWERAELGLARAGAHGWTEELTRRLLADGAVAGPRTEGENYLRPAILTALAAAHARLRDAVDTIPFWNEVLLKASSHPILKKAGTLRLRATAALAGAGLLDVADLDQALWAATSAGLGRQEAASAIAAVERRTERLEAEPGTPQEVGSLAKFAGRLIARVQKIDPGLDAFLRTLAARLAILKGQQSKAREHFAAALGIRRRLESPRTDWLDWAAPDNLAARVGLEFVRGSWARLLTADEVLQKLGEEPPLEWNIDSERLHSAHLQLAGSLAVPDVGSIVTLPPAGELQPVCRAHWETPPGFSAEIRALGDAGRVVEALESLVSLSRETDSAATGIESLLEADRAWFYVAFRMRLGPEDGPSPTSQLFTLSASAADADLAARWLAILPAAERAQFSFDASSRAWLRHRPLEGNSTEFLQEQARDLEIPATPLETADDLQRWVEALEIGRIAAKKRVRLQPALPPMPEELPESWQDLLSRLSPSDATAAALLRASAILASSDISSLARRLGIRRAALIALDEGTLLAWRLPECGIRLLEAARRWFVGAKDPFGEFLARTSLALVQRRPGSLRRLGHSYEAFRAQIPDSLASWDRLRKFVRDSDASPAGLGPPVWLPWLFRIAAAIQQEEGDDNRHLVEALALVHHQAVGEMSLPPELEFLHEPGEVVPFVSPGSELSFKIPEIRVLFYPQARVESWPLPTHGIGVEGKIYISGRSMLDGKALFAFPGFDPYWEAASQASWLDDFRRELHLHPGLDRVLVLEPPLCWICWEALLYMTRGFGEADAVRQPFRWSVPSASTLAQRAAPLSLPVQVAILAPSLGDQDMVQKGWSPLRQDSRFDLQFLRTRQFLDSSTPEMETARVVYAIGHPTATTAGARLQIGEGALTKTVGRGQLMAAQDLRRRSRQADLFILQPEAKRIADRSGSDREQSAYLRHMAGELHAAGAPAVLVLPALTQDQGAAVLSEVASALRKPGLSLLPSLLKAVSSARLTLLDDSPKLSPDDCLERALDITLFAADQLEWNLPEET
jgi:hypothetical protein